MKKGIALKVENVTKSFKLPVENTTSLKRTLTNRLKKIKGYKEQQVLKGISFEVEKGDFFGIVGRNGSGKSTLLKIISQIYVPEKGTIDVNGKLVSFIELGVGFNPELTGKENVYLNGAMLGFSNEEVLGMYDEIVEFAELQEFMDQKLKNYSSGMQVRLAFSVAIKAKGDILILDEVLAVGDEAFQRKCNDYFLQRKKQALTTILVTHDMNAVRNYCNKALLIRDGKVVVIGNSDDVSNQYSLENLSNQKISEIDELKENEYINNLQIKLNSKNIINQNEEIDFDVSYNLKYNIKTYIAFSITDIKSNVWIYNDNSIDYLTSGTGIKKFNYKVKLPMLNNRKLKLQVSVRNDVDETIAFASDDNIPVIIVNRTDLIAKRDRIAISGVINRDGKWGNE
ncbi:MAG: ABC transporter ATP-binding protein [Lactobacillales bacterium]|jgi:ABC-2 type transport system ATP-binding protein|nr:ABC transporter ATP-binding protein [Lactobacillales bacterium]